MSNLIDNNDNDNKDSIIDEIIKSLNIEYNKNDNIVFNKNSDAIIKKYNTNTKKPKKQVKKKDNKKNDNMEKDEKTKVLVEYEIIMNCDGSDYIIYYRK